MSRRWVKLAEKTATKSSHPHYQMGAVVFKTGRVLSKACNGERLWRHAEIRALSKDSCFEGASIIIARLSGSKTSRPCRACFHLIRLAGIEKMFFVDEKGSFVVKKVSEEDEQDYRDYSKPRR